MGFSKLSLALLLGLALMSDYTLAQDSPADFVNAHNVARAQVGVPPLAWDDTIVGFARDYANQHVDDCQLVHSSGAGKYGENLAGSTGDLNGTNAVEMWVSERENYDYNSDSCVGGECRHYTQVVWRDSVRLGCAKVRCNNGGTFIGCNYDPPGNFLGQKPY
ncbi:Pathogenesis-related protein 1 [Quillaja saponaria]|uniref:Pathogenesis-related protein 1 n=1 Tax=Quillaja saponaria TaxID=32244 RepID=A0AAD7P5D3_QUISA|nr:Pathogenesis-related protein 1 [Quillaja saponaria]